MRARFVTTGYTLSVSLGINNIQAWCPRELITNEFSDHQKRREMTDTFDFTHNGVDPA